MDDACSGALNRVGEAERNWVVHMGGVYGFAGHLKLLKRLIGENVESGSNATRQHNKYIDQRTLI
jgi:hypothetical protein